MPDPCSCLHSGPAGLRGAPRRPGHARGHPLPEARSRGCCGCPAFLVLPHTGVPRPQPASPPPKTFTALTCCQEASVPPTDHPLWAPGHFSTSLSSMCVRSSLWDPLGGHVAGAPWGGGAHRLCGPAWQRLRYPW